MSLRLRLLLITAALLLTGLTLTGAVVADRMEHYQVQRLDTQLRSLTDLLARLPVTGPRATSSTLLDPALDVIGAPYLVYLGPDGTPTDGVLSTRLGRDTLPSTAGLRTVPADGTAVFLPAADGSGRWRATARPTAAGDRTVIAAAPMTDADAAVAQLREISLISSLILLAVLTTAGWFALGRGLRPLRRVERTAAAIAAGDLTHRVPGLAPPRTELGRLAASLNTMLGQLERAFAARAASEARMRTFVSDVSHELRTPLFVIKGSTDLHRMGALTTAADTDQAMRRIGREATRLTALTEDLLLLAELDDAPQAQLDPAPMDLRTLATDARHDLRALDPTRTVSLTGPDGSGPPGPAPVHADEARLRQVVTNLIGNVAAHTPAGTSVRIGVGTTPGGVILEVADQGPGLTAAQADRVFDRFYRTDRARSRTDGANAGLGLAIARSLARAHGGDVDVRTAPGEGACFRLTLPPLEAL
ncbi:HAMP domain-containing sensor histidine kinase [Actinoplanes couchii]|uniref:histidine kinase n=1 Tax=Actinoplanes couchii TaxID=403638 RepID=A0ABQ3XS06_9ACTN|nr:HAMP domain-containing sensor histidine kinase [Actinoplanes couchii]MDR6318760.1 two-component system OmpR family sensor kinase [Actinoplanes couchii]GID61288.1 two-component sensor histidine kinase [Actinoplanes couchii]